MMLFAETRTTRPPQVASLATAASGTADAVVATIAAAVPTLKYEDRLH